MKTIFTFAFLITGFLAQAQNTNAKYYELHNRVEFYSVDEFYDIDTAIIYHSPVDFRVFYSCDTLTVGQDTYLVFTYPNFKNTKGNQSIQIDSNKVNQSDSSKTVHKELYQNNNGEIVKIEDIRLAIKKEDFVKTFKTEVFENNFFKKKNGDISFGVLTAPFKLRPKLNDSTKFSMSTDVSIGPYIGYSKRISKYKERYLTFTGTAGLTYINITDNNTTRENPESDINLLPGVSWSVGMILELDNFSIGVLAGRDYVSNIGEDWLYHDKSWLSFAVGHSFLQKRDSK